MKIQIRGDNYAGSPMFATLGEIQDVWAFVTMNPTATLRCISDNPGIGRSRIFHIVRFLEDAGYVQYHGRSGKTVLIPFVII